MTMIGRALKPKDVEGMWAPIFEAQVLDRSYRRRGFPERPGWADSNPKMEMKVPERWKALRGEVGELRSIVTVIENENAGRLLALLGAWAYLDDIGEGNTSRRELLRSFAEHAWGVNLNVPREDHRKFAARESMAFDVLPQRWRRV